MKIVKKCDIRAIVEECYHLTYWLRDVVVNSMDESRGLVVTADLSHPLIIGQQKLGTFLATIADPWQSKIIRDIRSPLLQIRANLTKGMGEREQLRETYALLGQVVRLTQRQLAAWSG